MAARTTSKTKTTTADKQAAAANEAVSNETADTEAASTEATISEPRRFVLALSVRFQRKRRGTGTPITLTFEEYEDLFSIGAVISDWEDGIAVSDS